MTHTPEELLQIRWNQALERPGDGPPLLPPMFVFAQGAGVIVVDLRSSDSATGPLGYVPGSVFASADEAARIPPDRALVFVDATGADAAAAASRLEASGRPRVAAMAGGLVAWRRMGLLTSRDPSGIRSDIPADPAGRRRSGGPVTPERVVQHVGDPRNVRWIKFSAMVNYGHCSCIDGRDDRGVVGTLGGDAGMFLLALAAIEAGAGLRLSDDDVARVFRSHLDSFGDFYMHSDTLAHQRLSAAVSSHPRLAAKYGDLSPGTLSERLETAEPGDRSALLSLLTRSEHVGCGHLRLMLERPQEYGIRESLVTAFIRAFFGALWDGAPEVTLNLLPGEHHEVAVLNIVNEDPIWEAVPIPRVSPALPDGQMFVNHPDVAAVLAESYVRFHMEGRSGLDATADQAAAAAQAVSELGSRHLAATVRHLAAALPVFDVRFALDGSFRVREAGR